MLEQEKRNCDKHNEENNFKKKLEIVFLVVGQSIFFMLKWFFEKLQNTACFRKVNKTRICVDTICFGKMSLFCDRIKSPNTTHIGVSASTRESQNGTFGLKRGVLGRVLEKVFFLLSVIHNNCALLKPHVYSIFSKELLVQKQNCVSWKTRIYQKLGVGVVNVQKGVFLFSFGFFGGFVFLSLFCSCFGKRPPKAMFLEMLEVFLFCSPKSILVFFLFCIFLVCLLFLPLPLLMFASFFQGFFPSIPLFQTQFVFWLLLSSVVFVLICSIYIYMFVSAFLFLRWLCFGHVFLLLLFCFRFVFLLAFRPWKKHCFPAILVFLCYVC